MTIPTSVRTALVQLIREDGGQDVVEYALLVAFFGIGMVAMWTSVVDALKAGYDNTNSNVQDLWDPPPPGGGP